MCIRDSGQTLRSVLLPQAITAMLPALVSQLVVILKDTALGYLITYQELLNKFQQIGSYKMCIRDSGGAARSQCRHSRARVCRRPRHRARPSQARWAGCVTRRGRGRRARRDDDHRGDGHGGLDPTVDGHGRSVCPTEPAG